MMSTPIDSLTLEIKSSSQSAVSGIEALSQSLEKLKTATKGGLGLSAVSKRLGKLNEEISKMDNSAVGKIKGIAYAVEKLSSVKVSATIGNQLTKINDVMKNLNVGDGASKVLELTDALRPLETLGKSTLGTTVNALNKLPKALKNLDTRKLYTQIQALVRIMQPLATEMEKIANGFNAFPSRIQRLIQDNERLTQSNGRVGTSYINLWAKMRSAYTAIKTGAKMIGSTINKSAEYTEVVNRFNVSMGEYAEEAGKYAENMSEILGIDPAEWMDGQAILMSLSKGFGVSSDRAYVMSKNLTQLAYDISSFKDISIGDAMDKIKSGLAGEIEPLRAIGYDLSIARLQQEAYALGIDKKVSAMTQAEKAELRYVAVMKSSVLAQKDMARTLDSPSNQLRIFKAQVNQASRAIGNLFIPLLNKVLPVAIAVTKIIRILAETIARLFNISLPEVGNWDGLSSGADDYSDALSGAADNAKKLKQYTMGFDELNVIDPNQGKSDTEDTAGIGGGFDFTLPEYKMIDETTKSKVSEIVDKMKEWLGLTDEINSWADLFKTKLGGILLLAGAIGIAFLAWKVIQGISGVLDVFSKFGGKGSGGGEGDVGGGATAASAKLKTLAKNLGLGVLIIAEVVVATTLFIGGIWLIGKLLDEVGKAWQPVIDNAGTIAIAMGIGTALLVGIGFAAKTLGTVGKPLVVNMALGIAILAEVGVATGLFLAEIWVIGVLLEQIGIAWQPVLDNGETIATGIAIGTGLLIGIGVVTALLGSATVASAGALPLAIGLGTAILVELAAAFILFCESLIKVADELSDELHPSLDDLNGILPELTENMEDFTEFMIKFAELTVEYTKSSAIAGFASTVDSIIKFFTKDPIKTLADDSNEQYKQAQDLNKKLALANPELQTAITQMGTYKSRIDSLKGVVDTIDTSDIGVAGFINLTKIGGEIAKFGGKMKTYYDNIKSIKIATMDNIVRCMNDVIDFAVRIKDDVDTKKIDSFTEAINRLTTAVKNLPTSKTLTISAIYQSSGSAPQGFASGGFPETGQMFIAREAGAEMVGTIGRRTAVANNDQIVAGIASGVAEANSESNALLREQNGLLRAMLEKETGVYLDGKSITKSVEKHQRERGRVLVTGGAY